MSNKGQVVIMMLMIAVVLIILGIAFAPTLLQQTTIARNVSTNITVEGGTAEQTGLNCGNTTNSFTQGTCIIVDTYNPLWLGLLVALAGAVLVGRAIWGN